MSAPKPSRPLRRLLRLSAAASLSVAVVLAFGVAVVGGVLVVGAVLWGLWRWPRLEARLFEPSTAVEPHRQRLMPPHSHQGERSGLGPEGHQAFARALHAVTAAYLAECEREAGR